MKPYHEDIQMRSGSLSCVAQEALDFRDSVALLCRAQPDQMARRATTFRDEDSLREFVRDLIQPLGRGLKETKVIIWQKQLFELAQRGADAFIGLDSLPGPVAHTILEPQLWYLDNFHVPITDESCLSLDLPIGCRLEATGLFPFSHIPLMGVHFIVDPTGGELYLRAIPIRFPITSAAAEWVALYSFLHLTLTRSEPIQLPRASRRRMERAAVQLPDIRIVRLRRVESQAGVASGNSREWQHQWLVSGHWRRLAKPRKDDGALVTFISPYIKGPEGKPLLASRKTVYSVDR